MVNGTKTSSTAFLLLISTCSLWQGCDANHLEPVTLSGSTMGTTYSVRLDLRHASVDLQNLKRDIGAVVDRIDRQMSTYQEDSEVSRFNRAAADDWFLISEETAYVIAAALDVGQQTGGALDITVGPLVRLWCFGPRASGEKAPPAEAGIAGVLEHVGFAKLQLRRQPPAVRKEVPLLEIDLSSVAKGYAVDQIAELLENRGIQNFLVEIGGELRARGKRPDGDDWRVGIERPDAHRRLAQTVIPLVDGALATSGDYRNFFEHAGQRFSHLLDPSTGRPVEHSLVSVSVVAPTCLEADALATALLVLGPERGYDWAVSHGLAALFLSLGADGSVKARASPSWPTALTDVAR